MGSIIGAGEPRQEDDVVDDNQLMDPGDTLEVGISTLYRRGRIEAWVKCNAVVHVRPGEEPQQTFDRGYVQVVEGVNEMIVQFDQEDNTQEMMK